jgi:hypothetical protein
VSLTQFEVQCVSGEIAANLPTEEGFRCVSFP